MLGIYQQENWRWCPVDNSRERGEIGDYLAEGGGASEICGSVISTMRQILL